MLSRHRELAADVGYPISLSFPPSLSFTLCEWATGPTPLCHPLHPRPAFAVEHRVLYIYIPARPFTHLCFCVQINLRRVKNGKRQSFGVDSDCTIAFQVDTSASTDKRSNWALEPFLTASTSNGINCFVVFITEINESSHFPGYSSIQAELIYVFADNNGTFSLALPSLFASPTLARISARESDSNFIILHFTAALQPPTKYIA